MTTMLRGGLAASLMLLLAACDRPATGDPAARADTPAGTAKDAGLDGSQALAGKLNAYVDCFNRIDGSARRSADDYTGWIADLDQGPTGKERSVSTLGNLTTADLDHCKQGIEQAQAAQPALPALDAAAKDYLADFAALVPKVSEAYTYYHQEDYKDDGFAKAKQMHTPLLMAFGRFIKASDVFGAELEKENDVLTRLQLAEIERQQGRTSAYYRLAVMGEAKSLAMQLDADDFEVAKATAAVSRFEALVAAADKDTAAESGKPLTWSVFQSGAGDFLKAAKERVRRIRDKTPYSHGEQMLMENGRSEWMVEGTRAKVVRAYNELVADSNRL